MRNHPRRDRRPDKPPNQRPNEPLRRGPDAKFYPLPKETGELLNRLRDEGKPCNNFGLLWQRLIAYEAAWVLTQKEQHVHLKRLADLADDPPVRESANQALTKIQERLRDALEFRKAHGYPYVKLLDATVVWRLVVGLGGGGVFEGAGLTLHPVFGIPYIPGSAAKGLARSVAFYDIAQTWGVPFLDSDEYERRKKAKPRPHKSPLEKLEDLLASFVLKEQIASDGKKSFVLAADKTSPQWLHALRKDPAVTAAGGKICAVRQVADLLNDTKDPNQPLIISDFCLAYGTQSHGGQVVFFDAYPEQFPKLELDIVNAHYGDYYQGDDQPPADYLSPNPVYFLTMAKGTRFIFRIAAKEKRLFDAAVSHLKEGAETFGVGAKTRAGYGEMEVRVL